MGTMDGLVAVHQAKQAPLLVELLEHLCGLVVNIQPVLNRLRLIILADLHLSTAVIADTLDPCGVTDDVVGATALGADPTTGHTAFDLLIVNFQ